MRTSSRLSLSMMLGDRTLGSADCCAHPALPATLVLSNPTAPAHFSQVLLDLGDLREGLTLPLPLSLGPGTGVAVVHLLHVFAMRDLTLCLPSPRAVTRWGGSRQPPPSAVALGRGLGPLCGPRSSSCSSRACSHFCLEVRPAVGNQASLTPPTGFRANGH